MWQCDWTFHMYRHVGSTCQLFLPLSHVLDHILSTTWALANYHRATAEEKKMTISSSVKLAGGV